MYISIIHRNMKKRLLYPKSQASHSQRILTQALFKGLLKNPFSIECLDITNLLIRGSAFTTPGPLLLH